MGPQACCCYSTHCLRSRSTHVHVPTWSIPGAERGIRVRGDRQVTARGLGLHVAAWRDRERDRPAHGLCNSGSDRGSDNAVPDAGHDLAAELGADCDAEPGQEKDERTPEWQVCPGRNNDASVDGRVQGGVQTSSIARPPSTAVQGTAYPVQDHGPTGPADSAPGQEAAARGGRVVPRERPPTAHGHIVRCAGLSRLLRGQQGGTDQVGQEPDPGVAAHLSDQNGQQH